MSFKSVLSLSALCLAVAASAQVTISLDTAFTGDGFILPGDAAVTNFTASDNVRGGDYNPVTGNYLFVSRVNGGTVTALNGVSGAKVGTDKSIGATGGAVVVSSLNVTDDGRILITNVVNTASATFKVYEYPSEADLFAGTGLVVHNYTTNYRVGDTADVRGTGSSWELASGFGTSPGQRGFALVNAANQYSEVIPAQGTGIPTLANGQMRLGIAFDELGGVFGTDGSVPNAIRYVDSSGALVPLTINGGTGFGSSDRALAYGVFDGAGYLAVQNSSSSAGAAASNTIKIYHRSATNTLTFMTSINPGAITDAANLNGIGSLKWGAFDPVTQTASLYALNTNNAIVKYTVQGVPEPASMAILAVGLAALRRRRKTSR